MNRQEQGESRRWEAPPPAERAIYRALFENADFASYVIAVLPDGSFRFEDANSAVVPFQSRPTETVSGRDIADCLLPDIADCLGENLRLCLVSGKVHSYERSLDTARGLMFWTTTLIPIVDREGRIGHVVGMTRDITAERRLLSAIGQGTSMIEGIYATAPGLIYLFDLRARCNRYVGGTSPLGYDPGEFARMGERLVSEQIHPDDLEGVERHLQTLAGLGDGNVATYEYRMRHKDGHYLHFLSRDTVFSRDSAGEVELILGMAIDISEQKGTERAVRLLLDQMGTMRGEERRRIAQDLHDSTAQHLIAAELALMRVQGACVEGAGGNASASMGEALGDVIAEIKEAEREIRVLSFLLHPPSIERRGIADAIRSLALGFGRRAGLDARAEIDSAADALPEPLGIAMFRVCQEALTNVYRHARAKSVSVTLAVDDIMATLIVADDGIGFGEATRTLTTDIGLGLAGMRERLERLGGSLEVRSGPGTSVIATAPRACRRL